MELFATNRERLAFLLETPSCRSAFACGAGRDAALDLDFPACCRATADREALEARAGELGTEELPPDKRPKYITNYIGAKQKLVDWIWKHAPEDVYVGGVRV